MADKFFTLDIDEKYTKIVAASRVADMIDVSTIGKCETPEFFYTTNLEKIIEEEVIRIKKLLETLKITGNNVHLIIPDALTYSQVLTMPLLNEKELISAIKYQADQFIPMPIEETNIDIEVIKEDPIEKKVLLLIVAASKKIIERIQTTVELAGLNPESVENELSSTSRFFGNFNKNIYNMYKVSPERGMVIADFDMNSTSLGYFSPMDLIIRESHHLSIGYQLFLKETHVNSDTDVKKAEEILKSFNTQNPSSYPIDKIVQPLVKEFSTELKIFISKYNPDMILFTNKICLFPALTDILSKELNFPVSIFNPYPLLKKSPLIETYKNDLPIFVPALGGSLR